MDFFSIFGTLWRYKWVSIPLVLLTLLGMGYVLALRPATYEAKADILLTNPPTAPTAFQISQDPSLAKMNNPLANMGNLTYVAEVLIDSVTAQAAKQELAHAGASGYQVVLDNATQSNVPPAIDVAATGRKPQAAMRSAQLVATAISGELVQLQASQHVQNKSMITAIEYVTPSSATKSSGNLETAAGVAAIGLIMLLVAVSIAQGRAEQKKRKLRQGGRSDYPTGSTRMRGMQRSDVDPLGPEWLTQPTSR
jgi:subunit length determinant Wzz-like protein